MPFGAELVTFLRMYNVSFFIIPFCNIQNILFPFTLFFLVGLKRTSVVLSRQTLYAYFF